MSTPTLSVNNSALIRGWGTLLQFEHSLWDCPPSHGGRTGAGAQALFPRGGDASAGCQGADVGEKTLHGQYVQCNYKCDMDPMQWPTVPTGAQGTGGGRVSGDREGSV